MNITFSARHFDATDKLQSFSKKELAQIEKYAGESLSGEVILEENGNLKVVDLKVSVFGKVLLSNVEGNDFYKIIPKAVDKLKKQVISAKSKVMNR